MKPIWKRGAEYALKISRSSFPYTIKESRIAATAFEAGWKAAKRSKRKS